MKYVLFLGKNYKDCLLKSNSVVREDDTIYSFATKLKHLGGIQFNKVISTDLFDENPESSNMIQFLKQNGIKNLPILNGNIKKITTTTTTTKKLDVGKKNNVVEVEEVKEADIFNEISDDFKEELNSLIEKEELNDEIMIIPEDVSVDEHIESIPEEVVMETSIEEIVEVDIASLPRDEKPDIIEADIKPVNPPRGWHSKKEFIDVFGNIFNRGKYVGRMIDGEKHING